MTNEPPKAPPLYPKSHLLAASGIAALLSLALLVFPSSEVEAKKTTLNLELESPAEQLKDESRAAPLVQAEGEQGSPFAQIEEATPEAQKAEQEAPAAEPVVEAAKQPSHREVTVARGDTLSTLFAKVGLPTNAVHDLLASNKQAKQFSQLKHGQVLQFELDKDGQLASLHSKVSNLETIRLTKTDKGYTFNREISKPVVRTAYAHGVIKSSLSASAQRAGLSHSMTMDMARVLGYDIDFAQDIRPGDEFDVVYEQKVMDGKVVGTGNILSARFTNRGKTYTAVRYTNKQGNTSYYTADGNSLRKAFIRTPVDFARISSRFSAGRKHPILNKIRAHKGVDYAAPRQHRDHPARQPLQDAVRPHAGLCQGHQDRRLGQAGPDHRLHRHHRPVHRSAPALRVPGQRCARRPAEPESADGRPDRQERAPAFPAAEPTPDRPYGSGKGHPARSEQALSPWRSTWG